MRLFEFYEKNPTKSSKEFFDRQDEIERTFNREAYQAQEDIKAYYHENMMDGNSVPVFTHTHPEEETWSNKPEDKDLTSPGYRGLQNVKRRAGHHDYDTEVHHENPHDEVAIPKHEADLIKDAKKRLGY